MLMMLQVILFARL